MQIVDKRYRAGSTIITSQLPVDAGHAVIDEPSFVDAILDRLLHNAHRLPLDGLARRKTKDADVSEHDERRPQLPAMRGAASP
ncbi:MAG: ATP-binding protein [Pseudomonadota bacterium]